MMTPERRAELRERLEVQGEDFNGGIVHELLNEIDDLTASNELLTTAYKSALEAANALADACGGWA